MNTWFNIREILVNYWDPIGISNNENLKDEYDSYIHIFAKMLRSDNVNLEQIIEELSNIEKSIGVRSKPGSAERTADKILELKNKL